jgi:hypothetical protein
MANKYGVFKGPFESPTRVFEGDYMKTVKDVVTIYVYSTDSARPDTEVASSKLEKGLTVELIKT